MKKKETFERIVEPGKGEHHVVIAASAKEVITWSLFKDYDMETEGWSFQGSKEQFLKEFKKITNL